MFFFKIIKIKTNMQNEYLYKIILKSNLFNIFKKIFYYINKKILLIHFNFLTNYFG
jgi:hypothetical protein